MAARAFDLNKKNNQLTVVAPLAVVRVFRLERELLQIGVGLGQQTDHEQRDPSAVEVRHGLRGRWVLVPGRVYYYHRQTHHVDPDGLKNSPRLHYTSLSSNKQASSVEPRIPN